MRRELFFPRTASQGVRRERSSSMQENPESADHTPGLDLPHTLRFGCDAPGGGQPGPKDRHTDGGTITLRGLGIYVEGDLADEGRSGSQPNN